MELLFFSESTAEDVLSMIEPEVCGRNFPCNKFVAEVRLFPDYTCELLTTENEEHLYDY